MTKIKNFFISALWIPALFLSEQIQAMDAGDSSEESYKIAVNYLQREEQDEVTARSYLAPFVEKKEWPTLSKEEKTRRIAEHISISHGEACKDADEGFKFYIANDFAKAASCLERAAQSNHSLAQELYADICLRQLDGEPHSYLEASMWYLLSAKGGNQQVAAYLESIIPGILNNDDHEKQMRSIVGYWVMHETLPNLGTLQPKDVNDYLLKKNEEKVDEREKIKIGKIQAQKFPYLFERITSAIMFTLIGEVYSVVDDSLVPQTNDLEEPQEAQSSRDLKSCALEAHTTLQGTKHIEQDVAPYVYGPVYEKYRRDLEKKEKFKDDFLVQSEKTSRQVSPIFKIIVEALHAEAVKATKIRATDLTNISHRDPPWLLAGIQFWKRHHHREDFDQFGTEQKLRETLKEMTEPLPEAMIEAIRLKIDTLRDKENEKIWPKIADGVRGHPSDVERIHQEYNDLMKKFFSSPLSRSESIVQNAEAYFHEKIQEHDLKLSDPEKLEILTTPFLMYSCKKLILRNLNDKGKKHYEALMDGQCYFIDPDLELEVFLAEDFNKKSKNGKKITSLLKKIEDRGIKELKIEGVTIHQFSQENQRGGRGKKP